MDEKEEEETENAPKIAKENADKKVQEKAEAGAKELER